MAMMNSVEAILPSPGLKEKVLQALGLSRMDGQEHNVAFLRSDLRLAPRLGADKPAIDFIELRLGKLPDEEMLQDYGHELETTPFQSPAWLNSWYRRFDDRHDTPVTAIGFSAGAPVFVLPLAIIRKFGVRLLSWQAYPVSDYAAPMVNARYTALVRQLDGPGILRQIARRIGDIDLVYVPKLPAEFGGMKNPFLLEGSLPYHARAHAVALPKDESWEAFFQRLRSSKTRKRLREKLSALEKFGEVKFAFAESSEEARQVTALCLASKTRQLNEQGHWDPFSEPGVRAFMVDHFASHIGRSTWACSFSVGGEIIATGIGFRNPDCWLLYQMALEDTNKTRYSPGTHMLLNLMKHCVEQKVTKLDLALGDEHYKTEWCDIHKDLVVSTLPLTPTGKLVDKVLRTRDRIRARLANDPAFYDRAKRIKRMAKKLRLPF